MGRGNSREGGGARQGGQVYGSAPGPRRRAAGTCGTLDPRARGAAARAGGGEPPQRLRRVRIPRALRLTLQVSRARIRAQHKALGGSDAARQGCREVRACGARHCSQELLRRDLPGPSLGRPAGARRSRREVCLLAWRTTLGLVQKRKHGDFEGTTSSSSSMSSPASRSSRRASSSPNSSVPGGRSCCISTSRAPPQHGPASPRDPPQEPPRRLSLSQPSALPTAPGTEFSAIVFPTQCRERA